MDGMAQCNLLFDESGNFLIYGSLRGIKASRASLNII